MAPRRPRIQWRPRIHNLLLSATMQIGRSLESSQIQDCSSGKLSKAFHTSTATVTAVRRELCFRKAKKNHNNWASVSEPHTCDFNATFSLYICICDRHCTSKIAINISIFHLGSYTRRARIVPRRGAVGPTHFRSHCPRPPGAEL